MGIFRRAGSGIGQDKGQAQGAGSPARTSHSDELLFDAAAQPAGSSTLAAAAAARPLLPFSPVSRSTSSGVGDSMSGLDMLSNAVTALLSIFNDGDPRHGRLQELMMDVKQMEDSLSVLEFSSYFESLKELKDLLIEELHSVYSILKRQDQEIERFSIMVDDKNRAVQIMAEASDKEREELIELRHRVRDLEHEQEISQERELKLRKAITALRRGQAIEGQPSNGESQKANSSKSVASVRKSHVDEDKTSNGKAENNDSRQSTVGDQNSHGCETLAAGKEAQKTSAEQIAVEKESEKQLFKDQPQEHLEKQDEEQPDEQPEEPLTKEEDLNVKDENIILEEECH